MTFPIQKEDTDARQRADSAFTKKQERAAEATMAWAEYQAEQVARNSNMERLRAERLAREVANAPATKLQKKTKRRRQVRRVDVAAVQSGSLASPEPSFYQLWDGTFLEST